MADSKVIKERIAEVKAAILEKLVALDAKIEAVYKLVTDEAGTAEVLADLDTIKADLGVAIDAVETDDPDPDPEA